MNRRPHALQAHALPTELPRQILMLPTKTVTSTYHYISYYTDLYITFQCYPPKQLPRQILTYKICVEIFYFPQGNRNF